MSNEENIKLFNISELYANPDNPYPVPSEVDLMDLRDKINRDPEFLELRPIVYDSVATNEEGKMMILGGNKRHACLLMLGMTEVPETWVKDAGRLSQGKKDRFVFADNYNVGEWDMEIVTEEEAEEWGIDYEVEQPEEPTPPSKENTKIVLDYEKQEYDLVKAGLSKIADTPEEAVWQLLGN